MINKNTATLPTVSSFEVMTGREKEEIQSKDIPKAIEADTSPPPDSGCTALAVCHPQEQTDRFSWTDQLLNMLYPTGYEVRNGCLMVRKSQDEKAAPEPVCNFTAWIVSEVTVFDGLKKTTRLTVAGKHSDGSVLPEVTIDVNDLDKKEWIMNNWGAGCQFANRRNALSDFSYALQSTVFSASRSKRHTVTGWHKDIDGWHYLIPYEDDPTVELPDRLKRYGLIREHDPKSIANVCELLTYPPASKKIV